MILETGIETFVIVFTFVLIMLLFFIARRSKRKYQKVSLNYNFLDAYLKDNDEIRKDLEIIPNMHKPINKVKDPIFYATSFVIFPVSQKKVVKIEYSDIYWVYGMEKIYKEKKGKLSTKKQMSFLVLYTKYGKYIIDVLKQEMHVRYLATMNIPAGYSTKAKLLAKQRKRDLKHGTK